jgi:small subunit ribosomal protein S8
VKRISKPGRRLYTKVADIHRVKFGQGKLILSTPAGILTNDEARAANVGGEQLFIIW